MNIFIKIIEIALLCVPITLLMMIVEVYNSPYLPKLRKKTLRVMIPLFIVILILTGAFIYRLEKVK